MKQFLVVMYDSKRGKHVMVMTVAKSRKEAKRMLKKDLKIPMDSWANGNKMPKNQMFEMSDLNKELMYTKIEAN